jgi:hypothetical protein
MALGTSPEQLQDGCVPSPGASEDRGFAVRYGSLKLVKPPSANQKGNVDDIEKGGIVHSIPNPDRANSFFAEAVDIEQRDHGSSFVVIAQNMVEAASASPTLPSPLDSREERCRLAIIEDEERLVELSSLGKRRGIRVQIANVRDLVNGHLMEPPDSAPGLGGGFFKTVHKISVRVAQLHHDLVFDQPYRRDGTREISRRNENGAAIFNYERVFVAGQKAPEFRLPSCLARTEHERYVLSFEEVESRQGLFKRIGAVVQKRAVEIADDYIHLPQSTSIRRVFVRQRTGTTARMRAV